MSTINAVNNGLSGATGTGSFVGSTSPTITTPKIAQINDVNVNAILGLTPVAAAVNYLQAENNSTGLFPKLKCVGSDPNIAFQIYTKGDSGLGIVTAATSANPFYIYSGTASQHLTEFAFSNTSATRTVTFPDASGTVLLSGTGLSSFTSVAIQVFTSTGTYTPTAGMVYCIVQCVGGGGGGGGSGASSAAQIAIGGGGGGGAYASAAFTATTIKGGGSAATVNIGSAGTAGANTGGTGGTGGTTNLIANSGAGATLIAAVGGSGGAGGTTGVVSISSGGAGGTAGGDPIAAAGGIGAVAYGAAAAGFSGGGGSSFYGAGGLAVPVNAGTSAGGAGTNGGGGSGAGNANGAGAAIGGAGGAGYVVITEFLSV